MSGEGQKDDVRALVVLCLLIVAIPLLIAGGDPATRLGGLVVLIVAALVIGLPYLMG